MRVFLLENFPNSIATNMKLKCSILYNVNLLVASLTRLLDKFAPTLLIAIGVTHAATQIYSKALSVGVGVSQSVLVRQSGRQSGCMCPL